MEESSAAGTAGRGGACSTGATQAWGHRLLHSAWPLPAPLRARCLLLFCALMLIKLALVVQLRAHLAQTHWRFAGHPWNWAVPAGFCLFVAIGVWSLIGLGNACRAVGIKAVRAANAAVLGLGLIFIFLTFHAQERNYLYPVMFRVLEWKSLGPYLALDLFFHPPFLAAWLAGYALAYYMLVRTGREWWTPYMTAAMAGAYWLLCLRELQLCRDSLFAADCLGLAAILVSRRGAKPWSLGWLFFPILWVAFAWGLFLYFGGGERTDPYFLLVAEESLLLFGVTILLARRWGFFEPWCIRVPFFFIAFLLLANRNYPMYASYNHLLLLILQFPHYFVDEFILVALVATGALLYASLRPRGGWWLFDAFSLSLIALALADFRLCQVMGVRLDWTVLSFCDGPAMVLRLAASYLPGVVVGMFLLAGGYFLALRLLTRSGLPSTPSIVADSGRGAHAYWATGLLLLGLLGWVVAAPDNAEGHAGWRLVRSCPIWQTVASRPLGREEFVRRAESLGLGHLDQAPTTNPSTKPADLNLLLVFMESSYNQHLSLFGCTNETQPLLSKYKDRMELFPNFFSSFASSIHARFATLTSLYPVAEWRRFTYSRVNVKSIFEVLHASGYSCSLFDSAHSDYTGFRDFLRGRGLDESYDADTMPGPRTSEPLSWGLREGETGQAIRAQIRKHAASRKRFFLSYFPVAPHYPYDGIPRSFTRFKLGEMGDYTPLYMNELLYLDSVITSIVDQLSESGLLDSTLVIITNDHGEQLGAKGGPIGHGWDLTPELANTPLIVMDPRHPGYRLNYTLGSQIDLLPTLLDRLGIPIPSDELYEGRSLDAAPTAEKRMAYLNTYRQFAVLLGNRLIFGQRSPSNGGEIEACGVYQISNQGSKTLFTRQDSASDVSTSIREFDDFQDDLLRHYAFYRDRFRRPQGLSSR